MKFQQIRNATLILEFGGKKFLIDPFLADKGTYPSIPFTNNERTNPIVDLPVPMEEILQVDAVIVTHLHLDHFDEVAKEIIPKSLKLFAKNDEEAAELRSYGFQDVEVLSAEGITYEGIKLIKTKALHGTGEAVDHYYKTLGITDEACGIVFSHPDEKTLYLAGDTIWFDGVQEAIDKYDPDIIILNGGDAQFLEGGSIIMGKEDIYKTYKAAPNAQFIVSHLEAVNHAQLTRRELGEFIKEKGISFNFLVPDDGESYAL